MRTLVCGGRDFGKKLSERKFLFSYLSRLSPPITVLIEGEAPGADSWAREWAESNGIPIDPYRADWDRHGRAAGPIRNGVMLKKGKPGRVVAFPGGDGTADMIRQAKAAGVPVIKAMPKPEKPTTTSLKAQMPVRFGPSTRGPSSRSGE